MDREDGGVADNGSFDTADRREPTFLYCLYDVWYHMMPSRILERHNDNLLA